MVAVDMPDQVLAKMNRELELRHRDEQRGYLGASGIGAECERRIWNSFHWVTKEKMEARSIKAIADGYHSEGVMSERLKMVGDIQLFTHNDDGKQFGFEDGHLRGHLDGLIEGVGQEPHKTHVWEHKCVNVDKFNKMMKAKIEHTEGGALEHWDLQYYAQAQVYMHYFQLDWHYMTICTPGSRDETSCLTAYNKDAADYYCKERPQRIINADRPPARISSNPAWFQCKMCPHGGNCHDEKLPQINCRTCSHSTPLPDGKWMCGLQTKTITVDEQKTACGEHLFNPHLMPGQQTDAGDGWIEYTLGNGKVIRNENAKVKTISAGSR